jgi:hypothetical protein
MIDEDESKLTTKQVKRKKRGRNNRNERKIEEGGTEK